MNKRKFRLTALITVIAILLGSICAVAASFAVNDDMFKTNTPTYIKLNSEAVGKITHEEDYEAYMFDVPEDGSLSVRLEHEDFMDSTKSGWKVTLYKIIDGAKKTYREISFYNAFWSDTASVWGETGVSKGTYCVVVKPGAYFLSSEFTFVTEYNQTTTYEREPNDTIDEATFIDLGYGKYGNSSNRENGTDIDWYSFELTDERCVAISFNHPDLTFPTAGWTITLVNADMETITQFTSKLDEPTITTGDIGLRSGKYHIKVESQTERIDTYTIVLGAQKAVNSEFEFNDMPETATELPENLVVSGCLADRLLGLDKDYFSFSLPADGYIDFEFCHENLGNDKRGWNIRFIKQNENGEYEEIIRKISLWNQTEYLIENIGLAAGDYFVCIDGDSVAYNPATYTCKWSFTEKEKFEKEPNSTMENAETIVFGERYGGAVISTDMTFDEDYYRFEIAEKTRLCLEFGHETTEANDNCWVANVVNSEGELICSVNSSLNQGIVSTGVVEVAEGTYYVKIETGMYGSEIPYYFRLVR